MAGRAPRAGGCGPGGGPRLTRAAMLRQAKSAAVVQREQPARNAPAEGAAAAPRPPRTGLARLGPPRADPKKIDFARPGMTKAMQMRQKAAAEKLRKDEEAQQRQQAAGRRPRRTTAPPGGDARATRQRPPAETPAGLRALQTAVGQGRVATQRGGYPEAPLDAALDEAIATGHIATGRGAVPRRTGLGRPRATATPRPAAAATPRAAASPIPAAAQELARSMNAEVVQAVPLADGPIDQVIIPPGTINNDRNTIVCIAPPPMAESPGAAAGPSGIANRSIQVISETLDQQDAAESAAVQGRLDELQNARREFVMAVANVGGNAVNVADDDDDLMVLDIDEMAGAIDEVSFARSTDASILDLSNISEPFVTAPSPPRQRKIVRCPDVSHEMFQLEYGPDHPDVVAAKEFARDRRREAEFARVAQQEIDDLNFDVPLTQDIMEGDVSFEEDEQGELMPCPSRIKASMPKIPRKAPQACPKQRPISVDELQRFFDLERYPPPQRCPGPPPGRETLHPDLWELEDPWYREATAPDQSDLMRFDSF